MAGTSESVVSQCVQGKLRVLGAPTEGAGMHCVLAAQHVPTRFSQWVNGFNARVASLLAHSTVHRLWPYLKKLHAREHREHLLLSCDPTEPAGAAGDALSDFLPAHARPGAHHAAAATEDVREALAVAVRMRRGGRSGSRRTREQPEAPYCRPFFE